MWRSTSYVGTRGTRSRGYRRCSFSQRVCVGRRLDPALFTLHPGMDAAGARPAERAARAVTRTNHSKEARISVGSPSWSKQGARNMSKAKSAPHVQVIEETPAYWRVVFDYPPFNIVDATIFEGLQDLLARMDASPSLRVVAFESANPDFYLAHFDLTGKIGDIMTAVGASGLPILLDTFVRLTKSSVVSIAKIRGCVRGASSEFVLACDMRFASRENTRLGQPEVGVGLHPGGGGTERLPHLVGRGRALEIVLGANDFDGDTAERYGYVNRTLPD